LTGDYKYGANQDTRASQWKQTNWSNSIPADRVFVPDPVSYFQRSTMVKVSMSRPASIDHDTNSGSPQAEDPSNPSILSEKVAPLEPDRSHMDTHLAGMRLP
jgi:hypothetical protein